MVQLVGLLERLGCHSVRTYIQSGNVVFLANKRNREKLAAEISATVQANYGFEPKVILLTADELLDAMAMNPFDTHDGKAVHVFFMDAAPKYPDMNRLNTLKNATEAFRLRERFFYLYTPDGVGRSKLAANIENCLGVATTARNWNTLSKLASMLDESVNA